MKTIGVLGGIGPQATMAFVKEVHRYAQGIIPPHFNAGYPPLVVYYCRFPPVLLDDSGRPREPLEPDPRFLDAAVQLSELSDFLVIPANAAHQLVPDIIGACRCEILDMIDVTMAEVERRGWGAVGLLGLGEPRVYLGPMQERGVNVFTIREELQEQLDQAIFKVMEGRDSVGEFEVLNQAIARLREQGSEGIVLGCTELPLLLAEEAWGEDLLDPGKLLAQAAVHHAVEG